MYCGALRETSSRAIATLADRSEGRFLLDEIYGDGGVTTGGLKYCLEQGLWTFAIRSVAVDPDPDFTPSFGVSNRFALPDDFVQTAGVWSDDRFSDPVTDYSEEGGFWYSDLARLYVKYVSNSPSYGLNLTKFPESYKLYVERYFASRIIGKLTKSEKREEDMIRKTEMAASAARTNSAMEQPTKIPARGRWASARMGTGRRRGE